MTSTNIMTDLELMQYHCNNFNIMYLNCKQSQDIIGIDLPFDLIKKYGRLFTCEQSAVLKSDEQQLLKKAIKRINCFDANKYESAIHLEYELRLSVPTKVFHSEKSDKLKLYHGLKFNNVSDASELTWITINDKVIDFSNGSLNFGRITNDVYYGTEIPRTIVKETILKSGLSVDFKSPNSQPNYTTIFIKSYNELKSYYENK